MKLVARIASSHITTYYDRVLVTLGEWHWHTYDTEKLPNNWDGIPYVVSMCAQRGHLHVMKYLHSRGIDIHGYNEGPLVFACRGSHRHIVRYLLKHGGGYNSISNSISICIEYLLQSGQSDILMKYYSNRKIRGESNLSTHILNYHQG